MHEARRILEKLDSFKEQHEVNDIASQSFRTHLMRETLAFKVILVKNDE
jgi:hypothetical protein